MNTERIGFGGGCHWCTEAVFQNLRGVTNVAQGFIRSAPPDDNDSEAVMVDFNPDQIPLEALTEIHLRTHASTSQHSMRKKYRSAVYHFDVAQAAEVARILKHLQQDFEQPLVTRNLPFKGFTPSDSRYHNYFENHRGNMFCQRYIDPKLDYLRQRYREFFSSTDQETLSVTTRRTR